MKKSIEKKILSVGLIAIGIAAIVFAVICLSAEPCIFDSVYVADKTYGGDAYTGMQNAAAATANNIKYLNLNLRRATEFLGECMGYLLLIVGLLLLLIGTVKAVNAFKKQKIDTPEESQAVIEND